MRNVLLAIVLCGCWSLVGAQTKACDSYRLAAEGALKEVAALRAQGGGDNSVVRASYRESQITNELAVVNMNLSLAVAGKCSLSQWPPVRIETYYGKALVCHLDGANAVACDRKNWKHDGG